jgi:hypothetical protein
MALQSITRSALIADQWVTQADTSSGLRDQETRTSKEDPVSPRRTRKTVWDDTEIVVSIGYT